MIPCAANSSRTKTARPTTNHLMTTGASVGRVFICHTSTVSFRCWRRIHSAVVIASHVAVGRALIVMRLRWQVLRRWLLRATHKPCDWLIDNCGWHVSRKLHVFIQLVKFMFRRHLTVLPLANIISVVFQCMRRASSPMSNCCQHCSLTNLAFLLLVCVWCLRLSQTVVILTRKLSRNWQNGRKAHFRWHLGVVFNNRTSAV